MSSNPHLYFLTRTLRKNMFNPITMQSAVRGGGGGSFHRPDPKTLKPYNFTRRYRLEDINTVLYHDFAPEYHMHLHSPWIKNGKEGVFILFCFCLIVVAPTWMIAAKLQMMAGAQLYPAVRPGKDHEHMAPALIKHMKENNYEDGRDFLGRRNAQFYKNFNRQETAFEFTPTNVKLLKTHGFTF